MSFRRSKRSIKTRKLYTAGNRADGKWVDSVEEASTTAMSIRKEGSMQRPSKWQAILKKEVKDDSDATVVMKDDDDHDAYPRSDEMHEESDAMEVMEDDAKQNAYSTSDDEPEVKRGELEEAAGNCNTVRTEDEIYIKHMLQA
jgi:hypothetical protein